MNFPRHFLLVLAAAGIAAIIAWRVAPRQEQPVAAPAVPAQPAASAPEPVPVASAPPANAEPTLVLPAPEHPLPAGEVEAALQSLVGAKSVSSFLRVDDFARRLVATVDNLGRDIAPARLWPVHPAPERFQAAEDSGVVTIHPDNAQRYTPFVLFVETIDLRRAVDLYVRMYPILQEAYGHLGFPGRSFNERLLAVIGILLAAPEPEAPVPVRLTQVRGPVPSTTPWVRYEYADPALEALPAGQKLMMRVGLVNERRLKKRLADLRDEIRARSLPAPAR